VESTDIKITRQVFRCPFCHENIVDCLQVVCKCGAVYHSDCTKEKNTCSVCYASLKIDQSVAHLSPNMTGEYFANEILQRIEKLPDWEEIYDIACHNSKGPVWLVGGKVYRTLAEILFKNNAGSKECDFDFLTSKATFFTHVPKRWRRATSDYSDCCSLYDVTKQSVGYRFHEAGTPTRTFDLITFKKAIAAGKPASLEGYFESVPHTVQAIALDIKNQCLLGPGKTEVMLRVVRINNKLEAIKQAKRLGSCIDCQLKQRIESLGFNPIRPFLCGRDDEK
jgi:hypothetical protein